MLRLQGLMIKIGQTIGSNPTSVPLEYLTVLSTLQDAGLPILRSLWTEQRTTFEGRYYSLTNALCEPKPVQQPGIPLWVGGAGEGVAVGVGVGSWQLGKKALVTILAVCPRVTLLFGR